MLGSRRENYQRSFTTSSEDARKYLAYREDLAEFPGNGWALYGLGRALDAQGRTAEAGQVEEKYRRAWARADEPTTTSCKCIPAI